MAVSGLSYNINVEIASPTPTTTIRLRLPNRRLLSPRQFFITTVKTPHLDGKHVVFGKMVSGEETLGRVTLEVLFELINGPALEPKLVSTDLFTFQ